MLIKIAAFLIALSQRITEELIDMHEERRQAVYDWQSTQFSKEEGRHKRKLARIQRVAKESHTALDKQGQKQVAHRRNRAACVKLLKALND